MRRRVAVAVGKAVVMIEGRPGRRSTMRAFAFWLAAAAAGGTKDAGAGVRAGPEAGGAVRTSSSPPARCRGTRPRGGLWCPWQWWGVSARCWARAREGLMPRRRRGRHRRESAAHHLLDWPPCATAGAWSKVSRQRGAQRSIYGVTFRRLQTVRTSVSKGRAGDSS